MMASTVAIPHSAPFPTFNGRIAGPVQSGYPVQTPVTLQGPMISGPVVNGSVSPTATINPQIQALRFPVVPVGGGCYNDGMEVVWHGEFSRLFSSFYPPHVWYLSITSTAPPEKWKFFRDSAKVRFCCQDCGNGWTSMKGRVSFWFHLSPATSEGFVQFKLYGQVCKKCNSGKFEYVMWYPEEVSKVMCNVYNKIGQTFYGFLQPPIRIDRRPGRPRNQHNADLCQACRDGECDQGRPVKAIYNYIPPGVGPTPAGRPSMFNGAPNQIPVVIRQPPVPPPGHVVMHAPMNSSAASVTAVSHNAHSHSYITAPVTLRPGAQPILTYSIVTAPPKDTTQLRSVSEVTDEKEIKTCKPEEHSVDEEIPSPTTVKEMIPDAKTAVKSKEPFAVKAKVQQDENSSVQYNDLVHPVAMAEESDAVTAKTPAIAASLSKLQIFTPEKDAPGSPHGPKNPAETTKMHIDRVDAIKEFKPKGKKQKSCVA